MSNTMWGGGHRGPRPPAGWSSWRPYVIGAVFLVAYLCFNIFTHPDDPREIREFTEWIVGVYVAGSVVIWYGSRWLTRWLTRRQR